MDMESNQAMSTSSMFSWLCHCYWELADEVNVLIDEQWRLAAEGGVSALNYAYKLNTFKGVFASSIVSVFYPTVAKMVRKEARIQ